MRLLWQRANGREKENKQRLQRRVISIASIAACLVLIVVGVFLLGKNSSGGEDYESGSMENEALLPSLDNQITFSEQTLIADSHVRVTALALDVTGDIKLSMLYENYTEPIHYSVSDITINGLLLQNHPESSPHDSGTISAGKYGVSQTVIEPSALLKDCFSITEIGTISFTVSDGDVERQIAFQIPERDSSLNVSGQTIYDRIGVKIVFKGIHKRTVTWLELDEHTYRYVERTEPVYEMVVYVENTTDEKVDIELTLIPCFSTIKNCILAL